MEYPILRYPDPKQGYILYTDASGIGWSGVLTQEHLDEKGKGKNHPICYISGQFRGSKLNWAALTRGICYLYVSTEVKLLRNGRRSDHQERPSASKKVLK